MKRLIVPVLLGMLVLGGSTVSGFAQAGLVSWWRFDESSSSTAADSTSANPGTLVNAPVWVGGLFTNALRFNGTNQYVRVKTGPILGTAANYTIEAWIKWDGDGVAGHQFIYGEGSFNDIIDLLLNDGVPTFNVLSGNWYNTAAPATVSTNEWHHLAAVLKSGVGGIIYVDGQPAGTNANMGPATQGTAETDIGRFAGNGGTRHFKGIIDEVRLFNVARSAAEILADYQQGVADLGLSQVASPDPVSVGSNVTFSIQITNAGPGEAGSVVLSNVLAAGVSPGAVIPSQGTWTNFGNAIVCTLGALANGAAAAVTITAVPGEVGFLTNRCSVVSATADPNSANNASEVAVTVVGLPPSVTASLTNETISAGGSAIFVPGIGGSPPLYYRWYLNGEEIAGATGPDLAVTNATPTNAGLYTLVVTNAFGSQQLSVILTVVNLQLYAGLTIAGATGTWYQVDRTVDLQNSNNWVAVTNLILPVSPYLFIDINSPGVPQGFYRAMPVP